MDSSKINVADKLEIKVTDSKKQNASTKRKSASTRALSGSGPWYLFTDLEPQAFYQVPDIGLTQRMLRQKCWHVLRASAVAWRVERERGHVFNGTSASKRALFNPATLADRIEAAIRSNLDAHGRLDSTPDVMVARQAARLKKIITGDTDGIDVYPDDLPVIGSVTGMEVLDTYTRSTGSGAVIPYMVIGCESEVDIYPWNPFLVVAPDIHQVSAWVKGQWLYHHLENQSKEKSLRERITEYDVVLRSKLEIIPFVTDGRPVALPLNGDLSVWADKFRTYKVGEESTLDLAMRAIK